MAAKQGKARTSSRPQPATDSPKRVIASEGQRLLLAVSGSMRQIAKAVGVGSPQTIVFWREGQRVPTAAGRRRLMAAYGIPIDAWSQLPQGIEQGQATSDRPMPPRPDRMPDTLQQCLNLLHRIQVAAETVNLAPGERVKLADSEAKLLALRARLEKENSMLEDEIIRQHPKWKALKHTIAKCVAPCARCAPLIVDELDRLQM